MKNLSQLVQWLRCGGHTGWSHELDYHVGRCRYCNQVWETLYPHTIANGAADDSADGEAAGVALEGRARRVTQT